MTSKDYLGFNPEKLSVTVFEGNDSVPMDNESLEIWKKLGIPEERIYALPMKDNWWGPAGETGPCGPDTEMFIDTDKPACGSDCRPGCSCGKYFEVWNDVFMQYEKTADGSYIKLKQSNVDTGMGVERTIAMMQGKSTVFETELFAPIISEIEAQSGKHMSDSDQIGHAFRVIADHIRSSVFIIGDDQGILPGNLGQGYVLRRLIRRSVRYAKQLEMDIGFTRPLAECVIKNYSHVYPELQRNSERILKELVE